MPAELTQPEPWLRGIGSGADPVIAHLLRSSAQIREDCSSALRGKTSGQLWSTRAGFHAKHLAGSTLRLCAYLEGRGLTAEELHAPERESAGDEGGEALLTSIEDALDRYEHLLRGLGQFADIRYVGRKQIAVTAIGLAIHIAEHGQRHTGQLIEALKSQAR